MDIMTGRPAGKLIVIGFMGGNVSAENLVHREALLTLKLQRDFPDTIHAAMFANRHGDRALQAILQLLDTDGDGHISNEEKRDARIVIFGHSWGASQTITLAKRLSELEIPVLLTVQVDSVQKQNQNDAQIPPNVREAVNFYQTEGLLRGRSIIVAADPSKTTVLGNFESDYRRKPVSCAGYPWYARAFMRPHIMIENDPVVWNRIEELIVAKIY
jgi:pimeloyl-ACP methyl ester carboxylesterase